MEGNGTGWLMLFAGLGAANENERKGKNMKQKLLKWATALTSCIVLLLFCGIHVQAAEYSIGTNDSWAEGSTEKEGIDYRTFTLPAAGRVTVTYQSYMSNGRCNLYDKDLVTNYKYVRTSGSTTAPATEQFSMDLEAGAYSLKLSGGYWNAGDDPSSYRVKVSFVPAHNNEKEPNDAFESAMPLANGTLIKGFLSEDDSIDFYRFSIGESANVRTTVSRDTIGSYKFSIWNSDLIEVASYTTSEQTKVWEEYLAPGTYYIKINKDWDATGTYILKWEGFTYVKVIQLKKSALTLEKGKSYSLLQSITPASANNKNIKWTSDNTSVAKVDSHGKVTAKGVGAANIKAAAMDGSQVEATCQVVVKPAKTQITACKKTRDRNVYVKVKAQKNVSGIQFQLSRDKKFKGRKSSYYAGATETKATTAALKKSKTYYFRARMYIDYGGKRYYGAWSQVKKVKTGKKSRLSGSSSWKAV